MSKDGNSVENNAFALYPIEHSRSFSLIPDHRQSTEKERAMNTGKTTRSSSSSSHALKSLVSGGVIGAVVAGVPGAALGATAVALQRRKEGDVEKRRGSHQKGSKRSPRDSDSFEASAPPLEQEEEIPGEGSGDTAPENEPIEFFSAPHVSSPSTHYIYPESSVRIVTRNPEQMLNDVEKEQKAFLKYDLPLPFVDVDAEEDSIDIDFGDG